MGTSAIDNWEFVNNFKYGSIVYSNSKLEEECESTKTRWRQINYDLILIGWHGLEGDG